MSAITAPVSLDGTACQFSYRRPRLRTFAGAALLCGIGFAMLRAAPGWTWPTALSAACFLAAATTLGGLLVDAFSRPTLGFDGPAIELPVGITGATRRIEPRDIERVDYLQSGRHALIRLHTRFGRFNVQSLRLTDDGARALYRWIDRHLSRD